MNPERSGDTPATPEIELRAQQRIYVASLSDYNNGHLHGTWIDADQPPDDIHHDIAQMLARSRYPGAEEWAIHDYEGFYGLHLGEYENIEHLAAIGHGIAEHGPAFAAWAEILGAAQWETELNAFEETYRGEWESIEAYAEELLDDLGIDRLLDDLDSWIQPYVSVDVEALARDMSTEMNTARAPDGGVYVFDIM